VRGCFHHRVYFAVISTANNTQSSFCAYMC
jgi:hypothetical protein